MRTVKREWYPGMLCYLCGVEMAESQASFDHIIPRSQGGRSGGGNLRIAHKKCNRLKGDRNLAEMRIDFEDALERRSDPKPLPLAGPSRHRILIQRILDNKDGWLRFQPKTTVSELLTEKELDILLQISGRVM